MTDPASRSPLVIAAELARAVYRSDSRSHDTAARNAASLAAPSSTGRVMRDGDTDVVVFRGTRSDSLPAAFQDWLLVNLRASSRRMGGGVVHAGFADAFASVRAGVVAALRPGAPLRLIGHSMGGALALVAGATLAAEGRAVERIVTFGAPAAADPAFLAAVAGRVTRVEAKNDLVPLLPPQDTALRGLLMKAGFGEAISCDFRPVGDVVYLADHEVRDRRPSSVEVLAGLIDALSKPVGRRFDALAEAHAMDAYVRRLTQP